jgi:hypothetical protein
MSQQDPDFQPLRSLTRLAFGGLLMAHEELTHQMRRWEQENRRQRTEQRQHTLPSGGGDEGADAGTTRPALPAPDDTPAEQVRYALVGLLFETQERIAQAQRNPGPFDKLAASLLQTIDTNPALEPLRRQMDTLVTRGETEVNRWIARGRTEEMYSRQFVDTALQRSFESSIHGVVQHAEVREMIHEQGAGLADELVEEVREHAVSTDDYLERLVRKYLKRTPRENLPEPPESVRLRAMHMRLPENHQQDV